MIWRYSPIDVWPGALRPDRARRSSNFRVGWDKALRDLEHEIAMLAGEDATPTIRLALDATDIRRDGLPRAQAKPRHPGVIVEFDTPDLGRLSYASDVYADSGYHWVLQGWRANLRAITLGLEALRAVERHGIGQGREQYQGFKAIGAGTPMGGAEPQMSRADALTILAEGTDLPPAAVADDPAAAFKLAAKRWHPDVAGEHDRWVRIEAAYRLLREPS